MGNIQHGPGLKLLVAKGELQVLRRIVNRATTVGASSQSGRKLGEDQEHTSLYTCDPNYASPSNLTYGPRRKGMIVFLLFFFPSFFKRPASNSPIDPRAKHANPHGLRAGCTRQELNNDMEASQDPKYTYICKLGDYVLGLVVVLEAVSGTPFIIVLINLIGLIRFMTNSPMFTFRSEQWWLGWPGKSKTVIIVVVAMPAIDSGTHDVVLVVARCA